MSRLIDADELKKSIPETTTRVDCVLNCDLMGKEYVNMLIDQVPTVDQWHYPSKGELPPNGGDYLIYMVYEGREFIRVGQYFGETGWYTDLGEVYGYWTPIAWMPLPEPPKEEA